MLLVQGLVFAVIYYFLFRFIIVRFDLKTPGREDEELIAETEGEEAVEEELDAGEVDETDVMAQTIFEGLGGDENIRSLDYCTTCLRDEVVYMAQYDVSKHSFS